MDIWELCEKLDSQSILHLYQKMNTLQADLECFWIHLKCNMLNIYGMENEFWAESLERNEMSILCLHTSSTLVLEIIKYRDTMRTCPIFHIKRPVTTFQTYLPCEEHNEVYTEFKFCWNQIRFYLQCHALLRYGSEPYTITPRINVTFILKHIVRGNIKLMLFL